MVVEQTRALLRWIIQGFILGCAFALASGCVTRSLTTTKTKSTDAAISAGGAALSSPPSAAASTTPKAVEAATRWVRAGDGLELALELPQGSLAPHSEVVARLRFRNATAAPLRVYLLPEPFRNGTCTILLLGGPATEPSWFPPPRPHGHLPSEQDFPLIEPGAVLETTQTILVPDAIGSVGLHWTYENHVKSWPGGVQTLDGPTKALFGGGTIPYIWLGKGEILTRFEVGR